MQSLLRRGASLFTKTPPAETEADQNTTTTTTNDPTTAPFKTIPSPDALFPKVDPAVDGEECLHDCASCTIRLPARFEIDTKDSLYGNVDGWATHLVVATGKTDWVRDVADEKGSVMEAVERGGVGPGNGNLKLSASNMPVPDEFHEHEHEPGEQPTNVLLLPSFKIIENVTPRLVPDLIRYFVNPAPTTTTPITPEPEWELEYSREHQDHHHHQDQQHHHQPDITTLTPLRSRPYPHAAVILLCSQRTRDARCGQSAPLLRREFERHLRALGLQRDLDDNRPGGVGIYFISHVGGHKYAANVIVYRRRDFGWYQRRRQWQGDSVRNDKKGGKEEEEEEEEEEGAVQGIWLARVKPSDCENIVRYTVLKGKVVKPGYQLRGGFDRERGVVSW